MWPGYGMFPPMMNGGKGMFPPMWPGGKGGPGMYPMFDGGKGGKGGDMYGSMFPSMSMMEGGKGMFPPPWQWPGMSQVGGSWNGDWGRDRGRGRSGSRGRSKSGSRGRSRDRSAECLRLPRAMMGRVIGKAGSIIKDIRERSGARIDIEDRDDEKCELRITGNPDSVNWAKAMILDIADKSAASGEGRKSDSDGAGQTTDSLEFPASAAGAIIGKAGMRVSEVRTRSGAKIAVEKMDNVDRCRVVISGLPDQVERARSMVLAMAEEDRGRKEEREKAAEGGNDEADTVTDTLEFPAAATGAIIGKGGSKVLEVRQRSGAKVQVDKLDDRCKVVITGTQAQLDRARAMVLSLAEEGQMSEGGNRRDGERASAGEASDQVNDSLTYPASATGGIIGTRGAKIAEVRQRSGAKITVEKDPDNDKCRVVISGTPEQVDRAKVLVRELAEDAQTGTKSRAEAEDVMEVPQSMVGRVIGKGGETIQRLQKESGAKIDVNTAGGDPCPVRISGSREAVMRARWLLAEVVEKGDTMRGAGARGSTDSRDYWGMNRGPGGPGGDMWGPGDWGSGGGMGGYGGSPGPFGPGGGMGMDGDAAQWAQWHMSGMGGPMPGMWGPMPPGKGDGMGGGFPGGSWDSQYYGGSAAQYYENMGSSGRPSWDREPRSRGASRSRTREKRRSRSRSRNREARRRPPAGPTAPPQLEDDARNGRGVDLDEL